ncbi:type II toxin-antitoxin system VapC family toxin [Pyrobaculum aerophilum]|uniref:type II toxin-antitoxin system VapC family toxin n=1 Tax=Pyrobaculum aerophilum TaxID=13773 RepID=UPI0021632ABF|nr:type II toxin-antitoxin system VapC family toxin [Pyrobaculum aerophilum]
MPVEYLVDASALYALAAHYDKWIKHREKLAILHLTIYEAGNALWKEARLGRVDWIAASRHLKKVLSSFNVLEDPPLDEVLRVAVERGLTFYDASYAYVAESSGLVLVTQDRELLAKTKGAIDVETFLVRLRHNNAPPDIDSPPAYALKTN